MNKFQCPHCGKTHLALLDRCPETGEAISEVQKLEGVVLAERYLLIKRISEGGMGVVYEGKHVKLDRRVAVKLLHPYLRVSPETMKRFENEARLAASIGHKNIVDVIDLGRHQGLPYFVMEYLDGEGLNEVLKRRETLPRAEAVDLCIEILDALTAVHAKGIVHRDLKPGNIMLVTQPGGSRIVKVLDFGICRLQDQTPESLSITRTGSVFGTPRYMSPEQARGEKDIDARADLYSVGIILYRSLTGNFPFKGENYNALLNAIANDTPTPPAEWTTSIPEGLQAIIMRAITRDIDARYQTAAEFMEALLPYSSVPPPVPVGQPTLRRMETHPDFRPTVETAAARAARDVDKTSGTPASWEKPAARRWRRDLTWLLPAAIVVALVAAVALGVAMFALPLVSGRAERRTGVEEGKSHPGETIPRAEEKPPAVEGPTGGEPAALLDVRGLPDGARVYLDGMPLPQIPILIEISEEPHALRVEAPGYLTLEQAVIVRSDTSVEVRLEPEPEPPAGHKKQKGESIEPPIDTTYPSMVGKSGQKKKSGR